jgi:hypothetical protein|tara:strand:- start:545 stop:787 length:243 start_codon:yes stop_codon:yes gene_type:complete
LTDFICAYFGSDWTITARGFSSARQAEKHGLYMMPVPGCFGFAVIEESEKGWKVCDDRSILSPNNKVTQTNDLNTFNVSV